jgi:anti-anti-sigma factor
MDAEHTIGADPHDSSPLSIDVRGSAETRVQRVTVAGEVDMLSAPALHAAVVDVLRRQCPGRLEIDLRGVSFLDSAGIRTLLICQDDAQRVGCPLALIDPHPKVSRVLKIAGLHDHFNLTDDQS